jgi:hypothetical protein
MICPHCHKQIPARLVRSERAREMAATRKTFSPGRPRSEDRCPCGEMTRSRADARGDGADEWALKCVEGHYSLEAPPPSGIGL